MSKTRSKPKFSDGSLVRKINPKYPSVRGFQAKKRLGARFVSYGLDFGQIGTVIKTENRPQKRKDRETPNQVFYCEVLWRGRDKTEWVLQGRLERVEGI